MLPPAMDEDDRPRPRGDAASLLAKEDLAPYSQDELAERIVQLEAEIARLPARRYAGFNHRRAASLASDRFHFPAKVT